MLPDWLPTFLPKLCCPATGQPLRIATAEEKKSHGIGADAEALVSEDGKLCYPIVDGIPHLLPH